MLSLRFALERGSGCFKGETRTLSRLPHLLLLHEFFTAKYFQWTPKVRGRYRLGNYQHFRFCRVLKGYKQSCCPFPVNR